MSLLTPAEVHFVNGTPHFEYDECYSCFEGRNLLFRLVNHEKQQWAFYNDTTDTVAHVHALFKAGSNIKALQRTTLAPARDPHTGAVSMDGTLEANLEVEPGFTELFIEGQVGEYSIDFQSEAAPAKDVTFEYKKPAVPYTKIYKCFKNYGNGLLFRLVDDNAKRWYFYNDTKDYLMKVKVEFANKDEIIPLGKTLVASIPPNETASTSSTTSSSASSLSVNNTLADNASKGALPSAIPTSSQDVTLESPTVNNNPVIAQVTNRESLSTSPSPQTTVVYVLAIEPGKTEPFIEGVPSVYKLGFSAEPFADIMAAIPEQITYLHGHPDPAIIPHLSEVYKCFKDHGNGLLFRIVDNVNHIWAFYNDTVDYVMIVNVRFPPLTSIQLAPGVSSIADVERPGGIIASVQIPPLVTAPFLVGNPLDFELAFSATPFTTSTDLNHNSSQTASTAASTEAPTSEVMTEASTSPLGAMLQPISNVASEIATENDIPVYIHSGPDKSIIEYDEVYKCFKEHGNGLLFRLVDSHNARWAFYNDTADMVMAARVAFAPNAKVKALGKTLIETDPEMGVIYTSSIEPLETVLFAEGEVHTFTTRFLAAKKEVLATVLSNVASDNLAATNAVDATSRSDIVNEPVARDLNKDNVVHHDSHTAENEGVAATVADTPAITIEKLVEEQVQTETPEN